VYAIYFDEVKYDPPAQPSYWIGGLAIPIARIPELEQQVDNLAYEIFENHLLCKETEFHGKDIYNSKANFKGINFEKRLYTLKSLAEIIQQAEDVQKIYVRIIPENIKYSSEPPESVAYMYFLEQVDLFLARQSAKGMVFGDKDDDAVSTAVASLARYKRVGTAWARGKAIENIVDTPHFARSHHSRMIQLADIFVYLVQFMFGKTTGSANRELFRNYLETETQLKYICQYRIWPLPSYWLR
jgi:hypothetical protein